MKKLSDKMSIFFFFPMSTVVVIVKNLWMKVDILGRKIYHTRDLILTISAMPANEQGGTVPQGTNPGVTPPATPPVGTENDGGATPPAPKTDTPNPIESSFFQEQMQSREQRAQEIATKLQDSKISPEEKLKLREEALDIKEMFLKYGYKQPAQGPVDLSFIQDEGQKTFINDVLKKAGPENQQAVLEFAQQLLKSTKGAVPQTPAPANLDLNKGNTPEWVKEVNLGVESVFGKGLSKEESDGVRASMWDFLGKLKA